MLAFHCQRFDGFLRGLHFWIITIKPAEVHCELRGNIFINLDVVRPAPYRPCGIINVGPGEVGPGEVGPGEVGPGEVGPGEVGPDEVGLILTYQLFKS